MRASEILRTTAHRPWPLPHGPWVMRQNWHELLFAHWPLAPEALRPLLPASLPLDTFAGQAWVGIVPFRMSGIRLRGIPPLPGLSAFPELNLRTYVTLEEKPGVYFFSLDATNPVAVALARRLFLLPYFPATMRCARRGDAIDYASQAWHFGKLAKLEATYRPVGPVFAARPGTLEHFLTERYCLHTVGPRGGVSRCEIHHAPWPLQAAEAELASNTLAASHGIALPETAPLLHYALRQETLVWMPYRVRQSSGA